MARSDTLTLDELASRLHEQALEMANLRTAIDIQSQRITDMQADWISCHRSGDAGKRSANCSPSHRRMTGTIATTANPRFFAGPEIACLFHG